MAKKFEMQSFESGLIKCEITEGGDVVQDITGMKTWQEAEELSQAFHGVNKLGNLTDEQKALIAGMIA